MAGALALSAFVACRGLIDYEDGFAFPTDGGGGDAPPSRSVGGPSADAASDGGSSVLGDDDDVGPDASGDAGGDAADASLFLLCERAEAGGPSTPISCASLSPTCGPNHDEDCCTTIPLEGGAYPRYGHDLTKYEAYQATVSAFALDKFEVTVARFRAFVESTSRDPSACSGQNPNNPDDLGWDPSWSALLLDSGAAYGEALTCPNFGTWTDQSGPNDNRPINCITWYEAQAFCIWDHGRLPTLAEWNYAAAGGADERLYPWGSDLPDASYADFSCDYPPGFQCYDINTIARVGSFPDGGAKWGQQDMAGNLTEWVQDGLDPTLNQGAGCTNCAYLGSPDFRILRGGSWQTFDTDLRSVEVRGVDLAATAKRDDTIGFRCARNP
jgi:formylglycine-generating enzyme required for sulfatase activity